MLKQWHFNVLFIIGVSGAIALLFGEKLGIDANPLAVSGMTAILAYVLKERKALTKSEDEKNPRHRKEAKNDGGHSGESDL